MRVALKTGHGVPRKPSRMCSRTVVKSPGVPRLPHSEAQTADIMTHAGDALRHLNVDPIFAHASFPTLNPHPPPLRSHSFMLLLEASLSQAPLLVPYVAPLPPQENECASRKRPCDDALSTKAECIDAPVPIQKLRRVIDPGAAKAPTRIRKYAQTGDVVVRRRALVSTDAMEAACRLPPGAQRTGLAKITNHRDPIYVNVVLLLSHDRHCPTPAEDEQGGVCGMRWTGDTAHGYCTSAPRRHTNGQPADKYMMCGRCRVARGGIMRYVRHIMESEGRTDDALRNAMEFVRRAGCEWFINQRAYAHMARTRVAKGAAKDTADPSLVAAVARLPPKSPGIDVPMSVAHAKPWKHGARQPPIWEPYATTNEETAAILGAILI